MGDRVVVMLDGRVQQVGAPKELYNKPTNRFVAGFIGSPAMNFVRARVGKDGTISAGQDFELSLPASQAGKVEQLRLDEIIIGIRPEHLRIQRNGTGNSKNVIHGRVEVVEPQGSTTIIQFTAGGDNRLIALINEQVEAEAGSQLTFSILSDSIYLFDPATDRSV